MYGQPTLIHRLLGNRRLMIGSAVGIVVVLIAGVVLMNANNDPVQSGLERLSVRYGTLVSLTQASAGRIRDDGLAKLNAEAITLFTSDNASVSTLVKSRFGTIPDDIKKTEADTTSTAQLQKAYLLNQYDATYASLLQTRFASTLSLITKVQSQSSNSETLRLLKTMHSNLSALQDRLSKLNL